MIMMTYSVHPKVYRLQSEINTIERNMHNAEQRMGASNPVILQNYRDMIRAREELVDMLTGKKKAAH